MIKDMDSINKETMKLNIKDESDFEKNLRVENKVELDMLWKKKDEGVVAFLKFCSENYNDWKNKKVVILEDDLKESKLKTTLVKTIFHYHPDRQAQDREGVYTAKDIFIRK